MRGFAFASGQNSGVSLLPMVPDPCGRWSWMAGPGVAGNPKAAGEKSAGRERGSPAQRCSSSTPTHFLMVYFFLVIYKQILWTFCILEWSICSLKYPPYFRTLAI